MPFQDMIVVFRNRKFNIDTLRKQYSFMFYRLTNLIQRIQLIMLKYYFVLAMMSAISIACVHGVISMCGKSSFDSASVRHMGGNWSSHRGGKGKDFAEALESAGGGKGRANGRAHGHAHSRHEPKPDHGSASQNLRGMISSAIEGALNSRAATQGDFSTTLSFDPDGAGPAPEMKITITSGTGSVTAGAGCGDAAGTQEAATPANDAAPAAQETAVEETAVEETVVQEPAVEEPAVEETAVEEAAADEAAVAGTPIAEAGEPVEAAADDNADPMTTGSVTPVATTATPDCVEEETPVAVAPVDEAPEVETPVAETPVAETPVEETPVAEAPAEDCPADDVPDHEVSGGGQGWGDPHFVGADGEKYDVQGEAGKAYNLLSDKGMQVNAMFATYAGNMNVMSRIGVTADGNQIEIGTNASLAINGETISQDGDYLGGMVSRASGKVTVKTDDYTVQTSGSAYLDVTFSGRNVQADGVMPTGIWGVTLDGDGKPRLSGGVYGTEGGSMQGGGVLEKADGSITDKGDVETYREYEVKDIMDLMFPTHNRYAA
jgi:hypothetical protein